MSHDLDEPGLERRGWIRSKPVKTMFRAPEYADLETIAEGWGVPVATAVWAIVVGELARWRREEPNYGDAGLAIAAAATVLRLRSLGAAEEAVTGNLPDDGFGRDEAE